jgi:transcriptional regulator of acetoin/glycerol metabolism
MFGVGIGRPGDSPAALTLVDEVLWLLFTGKAPEAEALIQREAHMVLMDTITRRAPAELIRPLEDVEREAIIQAVELCRGNKTEAARLLGISKTSMYRRLKDYGWLAAIGIDEDKE